MDPKVSTEVVKPLHTTIIGTGDGGFIPPGTLATTPGDSQPNIIVTIVTPMFAVFVRFVHSFLTILVGLVTAGMTPAGQHVLKADDFWHLVTSCATLSVAGAGVGLIKDLITIFGRLEGKYPLLTGNV